MWRPLYVATDEKGVPLSEPNVGINAKLKDDFSSALWIVLRWMQCPNSSCRQVLVTVRRTELYPLARPRGSIPEKVDEWLAVPRKRAPRPIDPLVPANFRTDYVEASSILEDSHRMSGVLSRRILSDLLKKYAGRSEKSLEFQIKKFIDDPSHPSSIKDNLNYLREIGNFGAHTQTDLATDEIIDASPEEAEWTLNVLDGLFDYFIVEPERAKLRRSAFDEKLKKAGRKPLGEP